MIDKITNDDSFYRPTASLLSAINSALFLKRPLLLCGEPGTGKTECAHFIARQLKKKNPASFPLDKALRFDTKSISVYSDLFYQYDAVSHFADKLNRPVGSFISFAALGRAIVCSGEEPQKWAAFRNYELDIKGNCKAGAVVLIDEIDKAPRDFPNDLLAELEKPPFKFTIREQDGMTISQAPDQDIFIIITSNNEKSLPEAFLRRCIFHYIDFPTDAELKEILLANPSIQSKAIDKAIKEFMQLRTNQNLSRKPSTSELIDWVKLLEKTEQLASPKTAAAIGALAKSKADFDIIQKEFASAQ